MRTRLDRCLHSHSRVGIGQSGDTTVKSDRRIRGALHESGTPLSSIKYLLHISNDEQKERLAWTSRGGNSRDTVPPLFSLSGYVIVMWRRSRPSAGSTPPAAAITASFFRNHFAGIRRSQWVCFMLNESMQEKLFSPLTRFSNGRKRKRRPIHSLDQGDWTGCAAVNGFPRQLSQERRVAMDDLTPPGHTGPPTRGRASDRSC